MGDETSQKRGRWTLNDGQLRISLRGLPEEISARVRLHDEEWATRGWLHDRDLAFDPASWVEFGRIPDQAGAPDLQDVRRAGWAATLHLLADVLDLQQQVVRFELVGTMSAARARLKVQVDGRPLDLGRAAALGFLARDLDAESPMLPPIASCVAEAQRFGDLDYSERLLTWARIRTSLERSSALLDGRVSLEVGGFLDEIRPVVPAHFSLEWNASGDGGRFRTLSTSAQLEDGTIQKLPYEDIDPRGIVVTDARRPLILPADVWKVVENASRYDLRLPKDVEHEVADPSRVIPEGIDADAWFDLTHYSGRVAGFERLQPTQGSERESSGLAWFPETDADDDAVAQPLISEPATGRSQVSAAGTRPGRLAAIVRELDAAGTEDGCGLRVDETGVPWEMLRGLLSPGVRLKEHQRRGIAWMWAHAQAGTPGVVLADDMGLGKTLQVACFLALRNHLSADRSQQLIVCPTVLIDNWSEELSRFFDPAVFRSKYVLYGAGLRQVKRAAGLDLEFLHQQQLIITNYETLASHQTSLLKLDFDVIALDEAHLVKNPDTLRSRAARALKRHFAIAMTGTPVENELSDIWAIYDAAQERAPRAFGTRRDFKEKFGAGDSDAIERLRRHLRFPSMASPLLRREKREALRDLPPKAYFSRSIEMTAAQAAQEAAIARALPKTGALKALSDLQKLYQHPVLLTGSHGPLSLDTVLDVSPKTRLCLSILEEIRARHPGEKALVFVISRQMQDVLSLLLQRRFDLPRVHIINGEPENRRLALHHIHDFTHSPDFDVMILSPLAAGVGLNIVAANHVVHYGRWWNPAKEDQATDRAYRIGQERPVSVYYPLLHRPGQPSEGFDMRLHELVERKRSIARDFLAPEPDAAAEQTEIRRILQLPSAVA